MTTLPIVQGTVLGQDQPDELENRCLNISEQKTDVRAEKGAIGGSRENAMLRAA